VLPEFAPGAAGSDRRTWIATVAALALLAAVYLLLPTVRSRAAPPAPQKPSTLPYAAEVWRIEQYVRQQYTSEDTSVKSAAQHLAISVRYLQMILKQAGKPGFSEMLTEARLRKAEDLLGTSDKTVSEICYAVGFKRPDAFARLFRKHRGVSPSEFRNRPLS